MKLYMFRTVPLSIIRSLFSLHSAVVYVKLVHLVGFNVKKEVIVIYREIIRNTCVGKIKEFLMLNLVVRTNILTARP